MKAIKLASIFALTSVALAVSTSSHAFDLVKTDDLYINFNGDIDLIIQNETSNNDGTEIETNFDDFDFDFKWKIDDTFTFIAATDWTVEADVDETVENDQSYAGFQVNNWTVIAGTLEDSIDPLGIEGFENVDMGRASGDMDGSGTKFEQAILAKYKTKNFWISGTYVDSSEDDDVPTRFALSSEVKVGNAVLAGGFGQEENYDEDVKVDFYQFQAEYKFNKLILGGLYSSQNVDQDSGTDYESTGMEFDAKYKVNKKLTLLAGYEVIENDISGADDYTATAIGAVYRFNKLVKVYLEAGQYDGTYVRGASTNVRTATFDDDNVVAMMLSLDF